MAECRPLCAKVALRRYRACFCQLDFSTRNALGFISVAIAACHPSLLHAQSTDLSGTVALSSQLVDRGLAITPATPIVQGAASWTSPTGWSLGLSGSAEVRSPGRIAETLVQGSRYWPLSSDWQMQASLLYYHHAGIAHSMAYDHGEAGVNWIYRDVLTFGLSAVRIIGARDQQPRPAADIDFHWPLVEHVSFSAGAGIAHSPPFRYEYNGHYHYDQGTLYHYGHAGLLWSKGPWRVELDRVLTDLESRHSRGDMAAAPWLATISLSF